MAASSCFRFFRMLRSMCAPIITIVGFSFLLTWVFILYQPNPGPGLAQKMGWQAWEIIGAPTSTNSQTSLPGNASGSDNSIPPPDGVDWWNVTKTEQVIDLSSLPLDVWAPLLPHDTGLSEISVSWCMIDPAFADGVCQPDSTSEQDAIKGKWVRVERNLNLEGGYMSGYLNLYYRRTRRQDINLITRIRLLPEKEDPYPIDGWKKAELSLRARVMRSPPLFLWYQVGKTAAEMNSEERADIITELDVLYGEDIPWYGFEKIQPPTMFGKGKVQPVWITYRRGVKAPPRAPPLHFSSDGKFKVLQIADLHFSVSEGHCRDTSLEPCENADNMTSTLISRVLDAEKPDLIVFSGDQLNGQGTSWDPKSVLAKFARAVTDRGIPWTAVFGNHDEDGVFPKEQQVALMKGLPYSLVEKGPKDVHGVGNYVLKVKSADASMTHLLTLYFLDSGSYSKGFFDWFGFFTPTEYDWIRQSQIDWFLQESASISPIERPFTPNTAKDLGSIWSSRQDVGDQITPNSKHLAKPNALMFFHIPLSETFNKPDKDLRTGKPLDVGISGEEPPSYAKQSDGFFEKGILTAMETDHTSHSNLPEVKAIGNGHCHVTENCRRVKGIWLCFGGGGSYSGYGKIGFDRRFRVYDIVDYGETIRTYKRTEKDEIVDEMILSGIGAPPM